MTSYFAVDIEMLNRYCNSTGDYDASLLQDLSLEAIEIFLEMLRKQENGSTNKLEDVLVQVRNNKVAECLGRREVEKIKRDFAESASIVSWNVNGLRSRIVDEKLSTDKTLKYTKSDGWPARPVKNDSPLYRLINDPEIRANVICMQETKITVDQEQIFAGEAGKQGWTTFWNSSSCTNYSGVTTWIRDSFSAGVTKVGPTEVSKHGAVFPDEIMDELFTLYPQSKVRLDKYKRELEEKKATRSNKKKPFSLPAGACHPLLNGGRVLALRIPSLRLTLVNTYVPNTNRAGFTTLASRKEFEKEKASALKKGDTLPPTSTPFEWGDSNKSGGAEPKVIDHREDWDRALGIFLSNLTKEAKTSDWGVVWCGDLNVARRLHDIHQGKSTQDKLALVRSQLTASTGLTKEKKSELEKKQKDFLRRVSEGEQMDKEGGHSGFRKSERDEFEDLLAKSQLIDVHRYLYPEKDDGLVKGSNLDLWKQKELGFTYWNQMRPTARTFNEGMRIDYFCVNEGLVPNIYMEIFPDIGYEKKYQPSDHAPILLKILQEKAKKSSYQVKTVWKP